MMTLSFQLIPSEVADTLTWSEKLETILTTAVGGYVLVFIVLALIWGILELFHLAFAGKKAPASPVKQEAVPAPAAEEAFEPAATATNEEEIVAAIMAAISAYTDKPASSFRVVSFRKTSCASHIERKL